MYSNSERRCHSQSFPVVFFFFFDIASIDPDDLHFPLNKLVFCLQQFGDRVPDWDIKTQIF